MQKSTARTKVIFFGTPEFAAPALTALHGAGFSIAAVVTQPDKPVGRGLKVEAPPVKIKAQELGLKVLQPKTLRGVVAGLQPADNIERRLKPAATIIDELKSLHAEVAVVVAYGKIFPREVLELFPRGMVNVHPSLLPKYRGSSPIQVAILNGDTETGVTIMLLDEEMDHGPVLTQHVVQISPSPDLQSPSPEGVEDGPGEGRVRDAIELAVSFRSFLHMKGRSCWWKHCHNIWGEKLSQSRRIIKKPLLQNYLSARMEKLIGKNPQSILNAWRARMTCGLEHGRNGKVSASKYSRPRFFILPLAVHPMPRQVMFGKRIPRHYPLSKRNASNGPRQAQAINWGN